MLFRSTRLTSLTQDGGVESARIQLPFRNLVSACPTLHRSKLSGFDLYHEEENANGDQGGGEVRSGSTKFNYITCTTWMPNQWAGNGLFIATYCLRIKDLRLHSCCFEDKNKQPISRVHLPRCHLHDVQICDLQLKRAPIGKPASGSFGLLSLRIGETIPAMQERALLADGSESLPETTWFALSRKGEKTKKKILENSCILELNIVERKIA